MSGYLKRRDRIQQAMKRSQSEISLAKENNTTNLFRKNAASQAKLDVRDLNHVLEVSTEEGWINVEGMTQFQHLVAGTLPHGVMPPVVPELKSITIGGAVSGIGIESSSFRYGLVHETVQEIEVLLGSGDVVIATPTNEHSDLFSGFPNSYGTLGYILRLKINAVKTKPYIHLEHRHYTDAGSFFTALEEKSKKEAPHDFIEGVVFDEDNH